MMHSRHPGRSQGQHLTFESLSGQGENSITYLLSPLHPSFLFFGFKSLNLHLSCLSVSLQEHAFESSQKYKEGKFIIELAHMIKDNGWD